VGALALPSKVEDCRVAKMTNRTRIACCQLAPDVERPERNRDLVTAALAAAIDAGAQVVVLPELCNSGYVFGSDQEVRAAAEPLDGELLAGWAAQAARGDAVVVGGFSELGPDGTILNSSALVDGSGVRAVYRKLHLWNEETRWFAPGVAPAPVVATRYGRIGLAICYDIEFPELARGLALQAADVIALPANWPRDPDPPNGRPILPTLAEITAYHNKVFVAVCDRCGTERGVEFQGGSVIAGPDGRQLAGPAQGSETIAADCALESARDKRTSAHNDAFADRRPEHYGVANRSDA
jgi:predicted amidohydrolase